jgi:hypothetical protein
MGSPFKINPVQLQSSIEEFKSFSELLTPRMNTDLFKIDRKKHDYEKKSDELLQVNTFLTLLPEKYEVKTVEEPPDFIITNSSTIAGLETCIVVNPIFKSMEGAIEQLFRMAETAFSIQYPDLKFLLNIHLKNSFVAPPKYKNIEILQSINGIIFNALQTGYIVPNEIIDRISGMPHDKLSFSPNLGAWNQYKLTSDILNNAILKKERLIDTYIEASGTNEQWLLLIIGGTGKSSYDMEDEIPLNIETRFSRVYVLDIFSRPLKRLK